MIKIEILPDGLEPKVLKLVSNLFNEIAELKENTISSGCEEKEPDYDFSTPKIKAPPCAHTTKLDIIPKDNFNPITEDDETLEPEDFDEDIVDLNQTDVKRDPAAVFANTTQDIPQHVSVDKTAADLDSAGFPWDARIHSAGKTKTKDGQWRVKKNISNELIDSVRAETAMIPSSPIDPVLPKKLEKVAPPPPPNKINEGGLEDPFNEFINLVAKGISEKKITQQQIIEYMKPYGIETIPALAKRLDILPWIKNKVKELLNA